jgi:curli biogenesis system outer membrane secretion channel CsgG
MLHLLLALALITQTTGNQAPPSETPSTGEVKPAAETTKDSSDLDADAQLVKVKRIYVESFGDDAVSRQLHSMIVASLTTSKRFMVTENKDKADAILKGTALEKTSQELHAYSEGTAAGAGGGGARWTSSGGSAGWAGAAAATEDSAAHTETIDHARVAVRLVNRDGDVIWAATNESKGAKYKGASADAADKIVKQLLRKVARLEKPQTQAASEQQPQ